MNIMGFTEGDRVVVTKTDQLGEPDGNFIGAQGEITEFEQLRAYVQFVNPPIYAPPGRWFTVMQLRKIGVIERLGELA